VTKESPWCPGLSGAALSFEPGVLNVNRDGSGSIAFKDDDLDWEGGEQGGPDYRFANIPASEMVAIRDFLNKWVPA